MKSSKRKLNSDKTEFIIIGTKQQRHKLSNHVPVKLLDNDICPYDSVRNLGVVFDSDFSSHKHVSNICKSCFYHIQRRNARPLSQVRLMWTRVHQAAKTSPHDSKVRRRSYPTISTWHADQQSCENKRRVADAALDKVYVGNEALDNVLHFEYPGSQLQGDGEDEADVRHRMDVAQAAFGSLSHLWSDHRLSRATKLMLYRISVCSTLTHSCEAWTLTRTVMRMVNVFNSRCLHVITGEDYRTTATVPA